MKTKMLSRCTACALALVLFFAALAPTVFADSTNHKGNDSLLNGSNYIVSYSMNGKAVVEQLTIHDEGTTRITRTVHPNNTMKITVVSDSGEVTTASTKSDYNLFYEIYQDQQNYKSDSWLKFLLSQEAK